MDSIVYDAVEKIGVETEAKLVGVLEKLNVDFKITECCGSRKICINMNCDDGDCNRPCCSSDIIVQTSNKEECRIRQRDIIYIAIENRKSAVYVDGRRIETNYSLEHWKEILNPKIFSQPHSSFLVNLCYVEDVTKDFVKIRHKGKAYSVTHLQENLLVLKRHFYNTTNNSFSLVIVIQILNSFSTQNKYINL